jgi:PAS domain S-box-containing protein
LHERAWSTGWITYAAFTLALLCTGFAIFLYGAVLDAESQDRETQHLLSHYQQIEEAIWKDDYGQYLRSAGRVLALRGTHPAYDSVEAAIQDLDDRFAVIRKYQDQHRELSRTEATPAEMKLALESSLRAAEEKRFAAEAVQSAQDSLRMRRNELGAFILQRSRFLMVLVLMLTGLIAVTALQVRAHRKALERQRATERQLRASEEQYRGLFENVFEGVYQSDREGHILAANPALVRMLGYSSEEELRRTALAVDFYADREDRKRFLQRIEQEGTLRNAEMMLRRRDGQEITVLDNARPVLDAEGKIAYFQGTLTDITDRVEFERELAKARDAALQASRMKSEFLANMSHEVRTPMNGILGMTSILLQSELTADQRDCALSVQRSASYLLDIINDVLDLSKIEAGKLELEFAPFPLRVCIEDVFEIVAERAKAKNLELVCRASPEVPDQVWGDAGRLRQVLTNLVGNAVKFTSHGEVCVDVRQGDNDHLLFEVTDTGIGITPDQVEKIFEPFCQGDGSTTRKYGGTGLGLTISRRLVELMGGQLRVTSKPGVGSTFEFTAKLTSAPSSIAQIPELAGRRALITGINRGALVACAQLMERWGLEVRLANDLHGAFHTASQASLRGETFSYLLVDIAGDYEISELERLRAEQFLPGTRLLLMASAWRTVSPQKPGPFADAEFLTKPVRGSMLLGALLNQRAETVSHESRVEEPQSRVGTGYRILVAEDHAINQKVAQRMLEKLGHTVDLAANGLEAIEALDRRQYSLILMDCQMPHMDGFEATAIIRSGSSQVRQIPIIAMTAHAFREDRERCLRAGMDDYLSKPVHVQELAAVLQKWLGKGSASPEKASSRAAAC